MFVIDIPKADRLACSSSAAIEAWKGGGSKPCAKPASDLVDGLPKCSQHAGRAAVGYLLTASQSNAAAD